MPKIEPFEGIYGVFADSLPDGWGRLLVDRLMRRNGINPMEMGNYELLMRLTMMLTKDITECEKLYRLMCFNVFAHNRDDHSKNFSYIYLEDENRWVLSPAYDLTYSSSLNGEHATTINGNGVNPEINDLLEVAKKAGLDIKAARAAAEDIRECVNEYLGHYFPDVTRM